MKMTELEIGDKAEILAVQARAEIASRLIDMGLVKGTKFKLIRKAPLGDPLEIMIRGFLLSLRLNEAKGITVEKIGQVGDGQPMGKGFFGRFNGRNGRRGTGRSINER
jgi:ferrous iron transport protein A